MKLYQALQVITATNFITIWNGSSKNEIKERKYFIKWHYKHLLNMQVSSIFADNNDIFIVLCKPEPQTAE
jgi:hypothetical protein